MGDLRVCFDTAAYQRALADVEAIGFDVSGERTELNGKYYCDGDSDRMFLIDLNKPVKGYVGPVHKRPFPASPSFWVDDSGKMFEVIDSLPSGVRAAIWGGSSEISSLDALMHQSLNRFYRCEEQYDKKCVEEVKMDASAKRVQFETAEKEKKQAEIADYIRKGNDLWRKAQQLIDLAEKCDEGLGGIDADDVKDIRNEYLAKKTVPTNLGEAREYYALAREMFEVMVNNSSGYECIEERGGEIDCHHERVATPGPKYCAPGEHSRDGADLHVTCYNVEIDVSVTLSTGYCYDPKPESTRSGKSY